MLHSRENPATETFGDGAEGWHAGGAAGKDSTTNQDVEVVQRLENIPAELPEIDRRHVTVVDTGSPCGKVVHQDGNLARAPGQVIEGGARTIRVPTPEDLAEVLRNLKPTEYIIPDFIPGTERFVLVTQKNYFALFGNMSGKPARSHEMTDAGRSKLKNGAGLEQVVVAAMTKNAGWTFGAWRVLDRDVDDYTPQPWRDLSVEQWLEILDQTLLPGVLAAPRVFMPSSKSRVGLQTANGHVWILCEGVEDTDALRTRVPAWAAARAAEAAAPLLWSKPRCSRQSDEVIGHATVTLFDHMVWTLHRQIYAGPPTVPAGLPPEIAQKRALRPAEVTAVSPETRRPLDLHKALPPLSERERVRYAETIRSEVRLGADGRVRVENHELLTLDTEVEIQHRGQPRTLTVAEFLEDGEIEFSDRDTGDQGKVRCQSIFRESGTWNGILRKYPDGRVMHHDNGSGITYWMRPSVEGKDFPGLTGKGEAGTEYPDLSHDGLALELGRSWGWNDRARYVAAWGKWMFWTSSRWEPDERRVCMTEVRDFLRGVANDLERWAAQRSLRQNNADDADKIRNRAAREAKLLRQAPTHAAVESTARSNRELAASAGQWDGDLDLLGTPAGVLELQKGTLRPARRKDYITKHTAVGPADGEPRLWLQFLHTAMQGDTEMVGFLQRLCGYILTGHTQEHKLPFLFGPGGNGKSVFANTLHAILKDYAARAPAEAFLSSRGERHPTDLAGMQGARLVVGSELPAGRAWNESAIKDLTGGDPITARFMRQDFFTYTPQFTLLIVGNHQPSIGAVDDAMRRRVLLIPFTAKIPEDQRDRRLEEKLRAEHGAILQWMAEGAAQWYAHGLQVPQTVVEATEDYLEAEDVLGQFIAEALEADTRAEIPSTQLYNRFSEWCTGQGAKGMTQRALTQALKERGFTVRKTRRSRVFEGYRLVPGAATGPSWLHQGAA